MCNQGLSSTARVDPAHGPASRGRVSSLARAYGSTGPMLTPSARRVGPKKGTFALLSAVTVVVSSSTILRGGESTQE
eukprot:7390239-Prymnesium_polylepis.2